MDGPSYIRGGRGRGALEGGGRGRPQSRNKHWSANDGGSRSSTPGHADGERWERGGHRGSGRGRGAPHAAPRKFHNVSLRLNNTPAQQQRATVDGAPVQPEETYAEDEEEEYHEEVEEAVAIEEVDQPIHEIHEPELETPEEREKFYQELVKAREIERKKAIAEGKMDDPLVPKRLEDAISIVGTCLDMAPRFERYRRERENNLFEWETIPGTKRVDHNRAVKMYERAAGDKTLPSDLRPPHVLKRTLDYLFHDLLPRGGFSATFNFIRDRSRAVRNDFTMQHITGPLAIECHDRCARFHILALHFERDRTGFSIPLEEQQLMNTLQSLKEFYEDQRGRYQSPTELEMRVYHRLIHIRDQKERHEDIPDYITSHPVFKLTTEFRLHVQQKSAPISKTSKLVVTEEGMQIFSQLASVLSEQGSTVMVYLVACLLERLFGKDTIDDIESIRGDLSISDIIDGVSTHGHVEEAQDDEVEEEGVEYGDDNDGGTDEFLNEDEGYDDAEGVDESQVEYQPQPAAPTPQQPSTAWSTPQPSNSSAAPASAFKPPSVAASAFAGLVATPNVFGTSSVFGNSAFSTTTPAPTSVFGSFGAPVQSVFGTAPAQTPAAPTPVPPAPAAPSPFLGQPNGFSNMPSAFSSAQSATPSNFFNITPTPTPSISTPQPSISQPVPTTSLFGGLTGSPFSLSNNSTKGSPAFPTGPSKSTPSLNPKAPEFTPPHTSKPIPSTFAQPFPVNGNGTIKSTTGTTTTPSFTPQPTTTTSTPPQQVNGTNFFRQPSSTQTPPQPPTTVTTFPKKPSPSGSASVTPPPNRLTAPPMLRIDTETSVASSSSPSAASPRVPPPLGRVQPISLPSTPSTVFNPPNPLLGHLRNTLLPSPSGSPSGSHNQEILSPLVMSSPTASSSRPFNNFTPLSTPQASRIFRPSSPPQTQSKANGKGKAKAADLSVYDIEEVEEMKKTALGFARRSAVVRLCFGRWMKRATDRAAYLEARKHGDEYRERLARSASAGVGGGGTGSGIGAGMGKQPLLRASASASTRNGLLSHDKKRRISANGGAETAGGSYDQSPVKKRARKRMSSEYRPPRTDEDLAKRLKENHEEHTLRWAPGSFLQVIRKHVKARSTSSSLASKAKPPLPTPLPWDIWLSTNPESDATAIWLERKFDVPDSGVWVGEAAFAIPLEPSSLSSSDRRHGYPGVIVFECTPLGDVGDELERKYRILDDCSRLREIVKALPPKRHFIPSLLIISWSEEGQTQTQTASDFFDMVKKLLAESTFHSYKVFSMTSSTKDLDAKLDAALSTLEFDTEGKLVQRLSGRGAFRVFQSTYELFVGEWVGNCGSYGHGRFNWSLYGQVVQVTVTLLNMMSSSVRSLLELELPGPEDLLPDFNASQFDDSESAYEDTNEWLSTLSSRDDARMVAADLQAHRNIGQDFPARIFLEHLSELAQVRLERSFPLGSNASGQQPVLVPVLVSTVNQTLQSFKDMMRPHEMKLLQVYNFSVRRSPKRRSYSVSTSQQGSPEAKRPRLSGSISNASTNDDHSLSISVPSTPQMNGRRMDTETPSPTNSQCTVSLAPTEVAVAASAAPNVTVAMLRALTRDLKKKYGS